MEEKFKLTIRVFLNQDEETLEIAEVRLVCTQDLFLCIKKDVGVPTVQLLQAEAEDEGEEEEEENIPITKSCIAIKGTTKPNLKGKGVVSSLE